MTGILKQHGQKLHSSFIMTLFYINRNAFGNHKLKRDTLQLFVSNRFSGFWLDKGGAHYSLCDNVIGSGHKLLQ